MHQAKAQPEMAEPYSTAPRRLGIVFKNQETKDFIKKNLKKLGSKLNTSSSNVAQLILLRGITDILNNEEEAIKALGQKSYFDKGEDKIKILKGF